jgi:DNA-binding PadR family transcriptional regulator
MEKLTDAELTVLGLVAEVPRHGYELEAIVAERGIREWTALGFSSIYYVLRKLEGRGLVSSTRPDGGPKGRRVYAMTPTGAEVLSAATREVLATVRPVYPAVLVGLANSPALDSADVISALRQRDAQLDERLSAVRTARRAQEPVPDFVRAIFDYGTTMLEAERAWLRETIDLLDKPMDKVDIKKVRKDLYAPGRTRFEIVEVPAMNFLMIDGKGDPNTAESYQEAVEALYSVSYTLKFASKRQLGRDFVVGPLEGLWHADDLEVFRTRDKDEWQWTAMIVQPDWISTKMVDNAIGEVAGKKRLRALNRVRFDSYAEGLAVQTLHIGAYDDEGPTIARMHHDFMPSEGLVPRGRHHEIYLSDRRKADPAKLKTIIRQPVSRE